MASTGLLHDIIVRPLDDDTTERGGSDPVDHPEYAVIAGSRRYYAAVEAGHEQVPCKIVDVDDLETAWTALVENTERRDLSEQELAQQLKLIYELVRPLEDPQKCPDCGQSVDGEPGLRAHRQQSGCELPRDPEVVATRQADRPGDASAGLRFTTERQALEYIAARYLGRTDDEATSLVAGHLRTAELPPTVQSLFKPPEDRTDEEQMAIRNYGVSTTTQLGSGEGRSGASRAVASLYNTMAEELHDEARLSPTDAVLETVGSLTFEEMSEQELRKNLCEFRRRVSDRLVEEDPEGQRETFVETLEAQAANLRTLYEEVEPTRPFKKVDVMGPETQRHSRWHTRAMQVRDEDAHSALVKNLYQERLETLADEHGWS